MKKFFGIFYKTVHVLCFIAGIFLGLFSILGVIVFFVEGSARVPMLQSVIINIYVTVLLFVPVHKTLELKKLRLYFYLYIAAFAMTMGFSSYTVYLVLSAAMLIKFFIVTLRMSAIHKIKKDKRSLIKYAIIAPFLALILAFACNTAYSTLSYFYGEAKPYDLPKTTKKLVIPPRTLPDIGYQIKGTPQRIWKFGDKKYIVESLLPGKGGNYPTLFMATNGRIKQVAQVKGIRFADNEYSISSFSYPHFSPGGKYFFIEEDGYEGGIMHAFDATKSEALDPKDYPTGTGQIYWSPDGKCLLVDSYEYGDQQGLLIGRENGHGYTMYPYDKSVNAAMGLDNLKVGWYKGNACKIYASFKSGILYNPKVEGENKTAEVIFDNVNGPKLRTKWDIIGGLLPSAKSYDPELIYP